MRMRKVVPLILLASNISFASAYADELGFLGCNIGSTCNIKELKWDGGVDFSLSGPIEIGNITIDRFAIGTSDGYRDGKIHKVSIQIKPDKNKWKVNYEKLKQYALSNYKIDQVKDTYEAPNPTRRYYRAYINSDYVLEIASGDLSWATLMIYKKRNIDN